MVENSTLNFASDKTFSNALDFLKFDSFEAYSESKLYKTILSHVLERDFFCCRSRLCQHRNSSNRPPASQMIFFGGSLAVYFGIGCACIASVCIDCYDTRQTYSINEFKIAGIRRRRRKNNPNLGIWYTNQFKASRATAIRIYNQLNPTVKRFILNEFLKPKKRRIPLFYKEYLRLS